MTILFDLDGTLLDTSQDFYIAINKVLDAEKRPIADYTIIRDAISFGSKRIIAAAFQNENLDDAESDAHIERLLPQFLDYYAATEFKNTFAFTGIDALLDSIEQANMRWGIVTNKRQILTEPLLKNTGYLARSACIVCGDTTSRPKPAPDPLLHACKLLNVKPEECIFIGDSINDILAGKAAGMRTIAAAFGFIPRDVQVEDWQADAIVHRPDEIFPWIQKWQKITS